MIRTAILNLSLGVAAVCYGQGRQPVAVVAGQPILEEELNDSLGPQPLMQLRAQEYEIKSRALENLIRFRLVEAEAKRLGIAGEILLEREADAKVAEPNEGEVEAYLLGQGPAGIQAEEAAQARAALKRMKVQRARQAYADSLRARAEVAVYLRPPTVKVAHDPARVRGDAKAPVTIVEFSDFQCPFCKSVEAMLKNILSKYQGRVKLAYRDFPLREIHGQAQQAAEAARCAGEQGKFWEFHDALFAEESKLTAETIAANARKLGLDTKLLGSCIAGGKYKEKIEADLRDGNKAGVAGTPAFFINGEFLSGARPQAEFEKIIERQLELARRENSSD